MLTRVPSALPSSAPAFLRTVRPPQPRLLWPLPSRCSVPASPIACRTLVRLPRGPSSFVADFAGIPPVVFYFSPPGCWSIRCYLLRYIARVDHSLRSNQYLNQNPFDGIYQFVCKIQGSIRSQNDHWFNKSPPLYSLKIEGSQSDFKLYPDKALLFYGPIQLQDSNVNSIARYMVGEDRCLMYTGVPIDLRLGSVQPRSRAKKIRAFHGS